MINLTFPNLKRKKDALFLEDILKVFKKRGRRKKYIIFHYNITQIIHYNYSRHIIIHYNCQYIDF